MIGERNVRNILIWPGAADWNVLESIRKVAGTGTPTVVIVNRDKQVILTEFIDSVPAVFGAFGATDRAILDLIFGQAIPTGKLPFDLPGDMTSVMAQAADVHFDMHDSLFLLGFGLNYAQSVRPKYSSNSRQGLSFHYYNQAVPHGEIRQVWYRSSMLDMQRRTHLFMRAG